MSIELYCKKLLYSQVGKYKTNMDIERGEGCICVQFLYGIKEDY